jgi:hypothetical protein
LDLVSVIAPDSVQEEMFLPSPHRGAPHECQISSVCGAYVFISPEDIEEVKSKMIIPFISSLWVVMRPELRLTPMPRRMDHNPYSGIRGLLSDLRLFQWLDI